MREEEVSSQLKAKLADPIQPDFDVILNPPSQGIHQNISGFVVMRQSQGHCAGFIRLPGKDEKVILQILPSEPSGATIYGFDKSLQGLKTTQTRSLVVTCWSSQGAYARQSISLGPT